MHNLIPKTLSLALGLALVTANTNAAIYTAATSGNFSSTTTWLGGVVPPAQLGGNDIIVNTGVTLNLDQGLELNTTNSLLQLNGTAKITGSAGGYLSLHSGQVVGGNSALIDVDSLHMAAATFTYSGILATQKWSCSSSILPGINFTIAEVMYVTKFYTYSSNTQITLGTGSNTPTVVVNGGIVNAHPTALPLTTPYKVKYLAFYQGINDIADELTGSGLREIEIAIGDANSVMLESDVNIKCPLKLTSGALDLSDPRYKLVLTGKGSFAPGGTGGISGGVDSRIEIKSDALDVGTMRMKGTLYFNTMVMNTTNPASILNLGTDVRIINTLELTSGRLHVQDSSLYINGQATITGGSANSYVISGQKGFLRRSMLAGSTMMYPIGTVSHYAPAIYTDIINGGTIHELGVTVTEGIKTADKTGTYITDQPIVNATWRTSMPPGMVPHTLEVMWGAGMEINGFNRAESRISQYIQSAWKKGAPAAATTSGNLYSVKMENLLYTGGCSIFDKGANVSVNDIVTRGTVAIYPNPATNTLHIAVKQQATATIYNTAGQAVRTANIDAANSSINIAALAAGTYYISVTGAQNGTATFVKR